MQALVALDPQVEIVIRPSRRSNAPEITVVA